ncbi:MAG: hypothetical protein BWK78_10330 [Thiotrichaceae bacterium IS1]|nr:MAG: hypothetical protein BWK78_10330 [Thiotrichaceae bacterium IS1]
MNLDNNFPSPQETVEKTVFSGGLNSHIADYIEESQLLLVYAARNGLNVDPTIISDLIHAKYGLEQGIWTAEQEVKFWHAFNTLTKVIRPVSIASLKATHSFSVNQKVSEARRTVGVYQRSSVLLLLVLLMAHIYWSMGSVRFIATAEYPKQIQQAREHLEIERSRISPEQLAESREINALEFELDRYDYLVEESLERLTAWNPTKLFDFDESTKYGKSTARAISIGCGGEGCAICFGSDAILYFTFAVWLTRCVCLCFKKFEHRH